ncbi:MAG: uracil-DNA glycosylase [Erysipelotrichaceae bacterium]
MWERFFSEEKNKKYYQELMSKVDKAYQENKVYPAKADLFQAFEFCPFDKVKVVIVGQDPYHGLNQANGLAFSVNTGVKIPPSLNNIFQELYHDLGITKLTGDLSDWAQQGVFLLNRVLSVQESLPYSHQVYGWQEFSFNALKYLNDNKEHLIFVLWGKKAQELIDVIDTNKHYIITSNHPSPLSAYRGFFGSKPFSKINKILIELNKTPIAW